MSLDERIALHLGALVLENAKKDALIEALRIEIDKRDATIKALKEKEPGLPFGDPVKVSGEARNGAH